MTAGDRNAAGPARHASGSVREAATGAGSGEPERQKMSGRNEAQLRFADFHEQFISKHVVMADTKAGVTFAVASGVLAHFATLNGFVDILRSPGATAEFLLALATASLLFASAAMAFWVIAPRRRGGGRGLVYWRSVAALPAAEDFVNAVRSAPDAQIVFDRLEHCYNISRVCEAKYDWLRRAMMTGAAGIFAAVLMKAMM